MVASRADPPLPLARLRARGELREIRAADLRFTAEEAADYLNGAMGLDLDRGRRRHVGGAHRGLDRRAAARGAVDTGSGRRRASFIAGFAGDDRFIVDYLAGEVLQRQPESVRRFLLETSVLDRLQGALCDAVTGSAGGKAVLESLDRQNLFVIPLDDRREWYRYHHLFADVLRAAAARRGAGRVRRRCIAGRATGTPTTATRPTRSAHAVAAGDFAGPRRSSELAMPAMRRDRQETTIRALGRQRLPEDIVRVRPVLGRGLRRRVDVDRRDSTASTRGCSSVEQWLALPPEGPRRAPA